MRLGLLINEIDTRAGQSQTDLPRFSVSQYRGVIPIGESGVRSAKPKSLEKYKVVHAGDLVLNRFNAYKGALGIAPTKGLVSPDYFTARPISGKAAKYLDYFLRSQQVKEEILLSMSGMGAADPNSSAFSRFDIREVLAIDVPIEDLDTQRRIADYLDTETAQIDAMMAKLDEQVGLLRERRGAVLGRVMDQSEVPTTTIGKIAEVTLGKAKNSKAETEGAMKFPYVRAANIQPGGVFFEEWKEMPFFKSELERYSLNEDDVLVVEGGAGFGRSLTLKQDLPETGFQNHVLRIRARENYIGQFIDYTVRYHLASGLIELMSVGATIPGLSSEKARALPIAHISLDEQRRLVAELDEKTSRIDTMITKCEELKTLLQERRAALITAVVTGQKEVPIHD